MTISLTSEPLDAIVLCGGPGTRLGALTAATPKPLLPVGGSPFLLRRLMAMRREGVGRIILAVQYLASRFHEFLRDYADCLPNVTLVEEHSPVGTGGALRHAATHVESTRCVALNGDSWIAQPLAPVITQHVQTGGTFTMVVVQASRVEGGVRHKGLVSLGPRDAMLGFTTGDGTDDGWVNAGCYVLNTDLALGWPEGRYDLESRVLSLVPAGQGYTFRSNESLLDIGTPDCYERANRAFASSEPLNIGSVH